MAKNHGHTDILENFQQGLEVVEFSEFHPVDGSAPDGARGHSRRFMTLLMEPESDAQSGGVGKVRRARNASGEVFACKTLHRRPNTFTPGPIMVDGEIGDPEMAAALEKSVFGEEYRMQSLLSNVRGFPRLYGYGIHEGSPVLVMEWVDGITLASAAPRLPSDPEGRIETRVIAAIGQAVLETLERTGILDAIVVHRDISPNNIMIRTSERSLEDQCDSCRFDVCLIDLGSSATVEDENPAFTQVTDILRKGTPEYAPPEMLTDDVREAKELRSSPAVDVYALCSVLYELYAAHTPYRLTRNVVASKYLLKMETQPELLVARRPEDEAFVKCVMEALSPDQTKRPTMGECIDVFARYSGVRASSARRESAPAFPPPDPSAYIGPRSLADEVKLGPGNARVADSGIKGLLRGRAAPKASMAAVAVAATAILVVALFAGLSMMQGAQEFDAGGKAANAGYMAGSPEQQPLPEVDTIPYAGNGDDLVAAEYNKSGLWGFREEGGRPNEWVIFPRFPQEPGPFSEGLAACVSEDGGKVGYIDTAGEWAIEPQFSRGGQFSEGLANAAPYSSTERTKDGGVFIGFIDKSGHWALDPVYVDAGRFEQGLCPVAEYHADGFRWGYIDTSGVVRIPEEFISAWAFGDEGLAPVQVNKDHWGFIDTDGNLAIPAEYFKVQPFSDGLALVQPIRDNVELRYTYIDASGRPICGLDFSDARSFKDGVAWAKSPETGYWGTINKLGEWTSEPNVDEPPA